MKHFFRLPFFSRLILSSLLVYIGLGLFLFVNQEWVIYRPRAQDFAACTAFPGAERVTHQGTRMYVHLMEDAPTAILYHGNAGSACSRSYYTDAFTKTGYGYIIVEYAGYSNDPEPPSHARIQQDVQNVIAYTHEQNIKNITLVGESLGSGVATYHASLAPPDKVLLIAPFTTLSDVAQHHFWFFPAHILVDNNLYDNDRNLASYQGAVRIIHGTNDHIVPLKLGETLFANLVTGKKTLITIAGAGHQDLLRYEEAFAAAREFLRE